MGTQEVEEAEAVRDTGVTLPWVEGLRTLGDLQVQLIIFCVLTKLLKLFLINRYLNDQHLMIAGDSKTPISADRAPFRVHATNNVHLSLIQHCERCVGQVVQRGVIEEILSPHRYIVQGQLPPVEGD